MQAPRKSITIDKNIIQFTSTGSRDSHELSDEQTLEKPYFGSNFSFFDEVSYSDDILKSEEFKENFKILGPDIFKYPKLTKKVKPFELNFAFGINKDATLINLTTSSITEIFYPVANYGVLYDYKAMSVQFLEAHQNKIIHIACEKTGRWLVTADTGSDNMIMVWDRRTYEPVLTLFDPYEGANISYVTMSPNGKLLISASDSEGICKVDFWLWTLGRDKPDESSQIKSEMGKIKKICFNPNLEEHMMIVFERGVAFINWDWSKNELTEPVIPTLRNKKGIGTISTGTYVEKCHESLVVTSGGCIIFFGNSLYVRPYDDSDLNNAKMYVKTAKISPAAIHCVNSTGGIIVTGDARGIINFFDKRLRLLYWINQYNLGAVLQLAFNLMDKACIITDDVDAAKADIDYPSYVEPYMESFVDMTPDIDVLYEKGLEPDASPRREPFFIRDFIILNGEGSVYHINYIEKSCKILLVGAEDYVAAIDCHTDFPYLLIAYKNGRICLYDYNKNERLNTVVLPIADDSNENVAVSCIKYSPKSLHLVCGLTNGALWVLEPIALTPKYKTPFTHSHGKIEQIAFSHDNLQFACYHERNLFLYSFNSIRNEWNYSGKIRSHYKPINDILFSPEVPSKLASIGEDRYLVQYKHTAGSDFHIDVDSRARIEQSAIPLAFLYYPKSEASQSGYFLTSDNQYKFKLVNEKTAMCRSVVLGPAYGCYKDNPVRKVQILPMHDDKYMIFMSKKHFGLQKLPSDGNPYSHVSCLGHPLELLDCVPSGDGEYVFTIGKDDRAVLKWKTLTKGVEVMLKLGGRDFEPFYSVLEGGKSGFLFQEMQDLFFYMQILHEGENVALPRRVSDKLTITELPDLMRACGYYPTDFEIETLMVDIKFRDYDETHTTREEISFLDFVKLFVNHKPAYGYSIQTLQNTFKQFCRAAEESQGNDDKVNRDDFLEILTVTGEPFTVVQINKCMEILLGKCGVDNTGGLVFDFIPEDIDFHAFKDDILGIDMARTRIETEEEAQDSSSDEEEEYID